MKFAYWTLLILSWILLTPAIILSIPGWIVWVIAKSIQPEKSVEEQLKSPFNNYN